MKPRYFFGKMDVINAAGAPPTHRLQIEIEVEPDAIDPQAKEVHEAIMEAMEARILRLIGDQQTTGELTMVSVAWIRQILAKPIMTRMDGIKIWGITLQKLPRLPRK
jgi:hypothetical protein